MQDYPACGLDFAAALARKAQIVNNSLNSLIEDRPEIQNSIRKAILYTLNTPGKRVRAALVLWVCELISGEVNHTAKIAAAAIEMVHTYSLVHDDLPAMDNDDIRRGQPSCHKAFNEATAILTGDALLTLAFEVLAKEIDNPAIAVSLIRTLAEVAGPAGMIAGQIADLESENCQGSPSLLRTIHLNKTAKMFGGAAAMGATAGGADEAQLEALVAYGLKLGLVFQVADDILDVEQTTEHLGKTAGKDARQGKITYPKIVGIEESRRLAAALTDEAVGSLDIFGPEADVLRQFAAVLLERTR
ncbi:MAG TPA: polyprenyl synthetase family protein [Anaerohalosphaeraceae bacterium]|jgi:geranylgeranyl pyrophosphate synthase|nr:polyprenyl synthetase family protein [Anaerohalosphaeraceae bacterium]HRT50512.1 polyprenyl synthetase family protein [Anaerohalosphaeraceae bacterium]HRT86442.1 polyprenyl synthetase family protein [Anaerohalosphaeraceae bacterium]